MPSNNNGTQSKLQRKRERDRRAQRLSRERTKARVASLESLVQDIIHQDTSGNNAMLVQEVTAVKEQRDQYARALAYIARIAATHAEPSVPSEGYNLSDDLGVSGNPLTLEDAIHFSQRRCDESPRVTVSHPLATQSCGGPAKASAPDAWDDIDLAIGDFETTAASSAATNFQLRNNIPPAPPIDQASFESVVLPSGTLCACTSGVPNAVKTRWRLLNQSLARSANVTLPHSPLIDKMNNDIPVRAVLEGWPSVMKFWNLSELPEVWQILRGMDDAMFAGDTGVVERIAAYRLCYRRIASLASGREPLPSWYLPRPSQDLPHSSAIDFVPWPGARERFVVHEHRYCSNTFWLAFARNLRILWPYSERDCYMTADTTYRVSLHFDECLGDLKRFTLSPNFFTSYPELLSDIPAHSSVPRATSTSTQLQLAQRGDQEDSEQYMPDKWARMSHTYAHEYDMTMFHGLNQDTDWDALLMDGSWNLGVR